MHVIVVGTIIMQPTEIKRKERAIQAAVILKVLISIDFYFLWGNWNATLLTEASKTYRRLKSDENIPFHCGKSTSKIRRL